MNNNKQLSQQIIQMIAELKELDPTSIKADSRLIEDLDLDSLDLVILAQEFQNEFGFPIPNDRLTNIRTVEDITNTIKNLTAN